ncbi:MAG: hypothetical protein PHQ59_04075 [Candidatus Daviesbacteria bacterium]|nr:hypothetical protein [Candidatus Daviesbacteria bacterium]
MNDNDKQVLKDSALVIADNIVASIDSSFQMQTQIPLTPFGTSWGLCKALFGSAMRLRENKALEWVEMVKDNPDIFTKEVLEDEKFQDGFVFAFEKYLIERNEEKRMYMRNIFLGFSKTEDKNTFPLEKLTHTLSQLSVEDVLTLKDVDISKIDRNYQIYGNEEYRLANIYNLINLGLLLNDPSSRLGPVNAPFVWISSFGKEFIKYIIGS